MTCSPGRSPLPVAPSVLLCSVMTRCHRRLTISSRLLLFTLLSVYPQLSLAAVLPPSGSSPPAARHDSIRPQGAVAAAVALVSRVDHGSARTHRREDPARIVPDTSEERALPSSPADASSAAWALAVALVDSMDQPRKEVVEEVGHIDTIAGNSKPLLQRETRGYFQNIDLGLQDNEILPPLKGYKAYNQQLAQATKKIKWHEAASKSPSATGRNFMDDFDVPGQEEMEEEEARMLSRQGAEEARARAELEEMRRQQAEAEAAREEEQRLAGIASDMLIQYMDRKTANKQQQTSYMKQRQKASVLGGLEDKRSNEVENDSDDIFGDLDMDMDGGDVELETIDRLIEISSKLHLPADDVVEIISNVEEKKRRKMDAAVQVPPAVSAPRYRPLVAPARPQSSSPVLYKYAPAAPSPALAGPLFAPAPPPKKLSKPMKSAKPYKNKWYKEKGKSRAFKQDYWFKPAKQFMAYPSYPYYQKPYRAYYPVYFPPPKPRLYSKPPFAYDYDFEDSMDYGMKPPKRRNMGKMKGAKGKGKGGQSWKMMSLAPPAPPYIPNYILPHPRTYYPLPPVPKPPQQNPLANRRPSLASSRFYPQDYDNDGVGETQDSDEELENFIEKMYFHRRIF
ncbi:neurosecretory protein VGF [Engraulis encrasicolus]|uniref:neurosecretory protein VGF n=1 Tax=Engraulis encrasicolus TaxID=184585 RepID=UPI002FD1241E